MGKNILIAGGSGLVGRRLTTMLQEAGHQVAWLSRSAGGKGEVHRFVWNMAEGTIDPEALKWAQVVVHAAGSNVSGQRWNEKYKHDILTSRTDSTRMLMEAIQQAPNKPESYLAATAIGYYGEDAGEALLTEDSPKGGGFLAEVVEQWEAAVSGIEALGIRTVRVRVGIVLSNSSGALVELAKPVRMGFGAPLGTGRQWMSWVHIDDLCRMFMWAMDNPAAKGAYNGVAPEPETNRQFTKAVARQLKKPLWLPPVPGFALKLMVGEFAGTLLGGLKVSAQKASNAGFHFEHPQLEEALQDLLPR